MVEEKCDVCGVKIGGLDHSATLHGTKMDM